ncbi:uncharacterized protein Z519_00729 [Cladophialophora bantiana CBS 173.52]|uniref:Uncharacterized protein n=1 Tax=Cladophialophora bantiana (strain ATCC 10958 / CBS 173.52 / CDC B-1940 / NIH 8579) TaxID=1442370 RepID=A0A0D2FAF5_CLAB1|nr:uncharacterized protein Z519_00729 [Cladophialophora bantiana CBS 173.52]KIW99066.1 hypothetical protein Z519_00729 [Cladophialophora bantiana CBS 173.52]
MPKDDSIVTKAGLQQGHITAGMQSTPSTTQQSLDQLIVIGGSIGSAEPQPVLCMVWCYADRIPRS